MSTNIETSEYSEYFISLAENWDQYPGHASTTVELDSEHELELILVAIDNSNSVRYHA